MITSPEKGLAAGTKATSTLYPLAIAFAITKNLQHKCNDSEQFLKEKKKRQ